MATFTPLRGTRDIIEKIDMVDGQFLFETDQGEYNRIYADIYDETGVLKRVQVGGDRKDALYWKDIVGRPFTDLSDEFVVKEEADPIDPAKKIYVLNIDIMTADRLNEIFLDIF